VPGSEPVSSPELRPEAIRITTQRPETSSSQLISQLTSSSQLISQLTSQSGIRTTTQEAELSSVHETFMSVLKPVCFRDASEINIACFLPFFLYKKPV
jgi:hypothetical protein